MGRKERAADDDVLDDIADQFVQQGHAFDQLLIDVVSTQAFGYRRIEE